MTKNFKILPLLISALMVFSACEYTIPEMEMEEEIIEKTEDKVDVETIEMPKEGGVLELSTRMPKTLNPLINEDVTVDRVLKLIFEPLVLFDENQEPILNLLEEAEISEDGLTLQIRLKDNLTWSDGKKITAQDISFSLGIISASEDTSMYKNCVYDISSYKVLDELSVSIDFHSNLKGSLESLVFPIIPSHYYDKSLKPDSETNMNPLGNGPYKFDNYKWTQEINLSINNKTLKSKPYISSVKILVTPDYETDLYAFNEGIIDAVSTDIASWGKYRSNKTAEIASFPILSYDFIGFNFSKDIFKDIDIRKAIAHSLDVDEAVLNIYLNYAKKAGSPIHPLEEFYSEEDNVNYEYSPSIAEGYVKKAGYALVGETYIKEGDNIERELAFNIIVNRENAERVKIAKILKSNLSKINIKANISELTFEQYKETLESGNFDIFIGGFNFSNSKDLSFAFHSTGEKNYFSYRNLELDSYLEASKNAKTKDELKENLKYVQKYISEDLPCISICFREAVLLTDTRVKGEKKPLKDNIFFNINEWYLN